MFLGLAERAERGSEEQRAFVAAAITAAVRRLTVHVNIISGTEPKWLPRDGNHDPIACDLVAAKDDLLVLANALEHAPLSRAWDRVLIRLRKHGVKLPKSPAGPFGERLCLHVLVPECARWAVETVDRYLKSADEECDRPPIRFGGRGESPVTPNKGPAGGGQAGDGRGRHPARRTGN
jgi:hypothetical protein